MRKMRKFTELYEETIKNKDEIVPIINKDNYKKIKYYSDKPLKEQTLEELVARIFHVKDIYRGMKGPMKALLKMDLRNIWFELQDRNKWKTFKKYKSKMK